MKGTCFYVFFNGLVMFDWETKTWSFRRLRKNIKRLEKAQKLSIETVRSFFKAKRYMRKWHKKTQ